MNPNATHILEKNPEKIIWLFFSSNSSAIRLLEKNLDKISWAILSSNQSIFAKKINYTYLKKKQDIIKEELIMKCMHRSRLERWLEMGGDIDDF